MTEALLIRVDRRQSTSADLRTTIRGGHSDADAENAIFHTLLYTLTSRLSMTVQLLRGQIHLSFRQAEVVVVLEKFLPKLSSRKEFRIRLIKAVFIRN
jgi:hypothetical protein